MGRARILTSTVALALVLGLTAQARPQGFAPDVAASRMMPADGLAVNLYAAEPDVRQPILVKFDDRGRLWTIQYLQYPTPAGLKRVKVDRWSRTVYSRIPEPPPKGPRGHDRITICEDTDGDGRADRFKDFVTGLNLCTGLAFGHGGVYVLQVPYLLFYPDRDRDDVPDGEPEVLLSGFGMEDAQSLGQPPHLGPGRLALWRHRQHVEQPRPRRRVPAGRLAISPAVETVRAVLRGGRQPVRPDVRRRRQPVLLVQRQ